VKCTRMSRPLTTRTGFTTYQGSCCLQAAHAQLASREGRISQPLLARMAQHLLARHPAAANQGWVMEGWMRSLAAAQLLTCSTAGSGGLTAADKAANRRATGTAVKVGDALAAHTVLALHKRCHMAWHARQHIQTRCRRG
jgi:hypothetical protein